MVFMYSISDCKDTGSDKVAELFAKTKGMRVGAACLASLKLFRSHAITVLASHYANLAEGGMLAEENGTVNEIMKEFVVFMEECDELVEDDRKAKDNGTERLKHFAELTLEFPKVQAALNSAKATVADGSPPDAEMMALLEGTLAVQESMAAVIASSWDWVTFPVAFAYICVINHGGVVQ